MKIFTCDDDENIINQLSTYIQEYFKKSLKSPILIPCCYYVITKKIEKYAFESKFNTFRIKSDRIKSDFKNKKLKILR